MPYDSETSQYERRATTVIDATPDGDTVAVAIDVKLDQGIDDYVADLNHHAANGRHYPATSVGSDSRFLRQSPTGVVSWANGVVAADAALKDFSNVASGAIPNAKLANEPALKDFSNVASGAISNDKLAIIQNDKLAIIQNDKLAPISPSKITQDASNRFTTDAEKAQWFIPVYDARRGYNYIINGNFDIWQRGTSQTTSAYGSADRWLCKNIGTTKTASRQAFTLGQTEVPDNPMYYMRHVVNSVAGVNNYCLLENRIEYVKTLAGKKATLSFWAKADAPKNIAIEFAQNLGTGGTPSYQVQGIGSQLVALTTSWKKYTITVDIPRIAGKTLGTDSNDCLICRFWFDAGSNFADRALSLGQQSGTFDIANVSLVEGDIDVKPIPRSVGEELALCQRYYQVHKECRISGYTTGNNEISCTLIYNTMRSDPIHSTSNFTMLNVKNNAVYPTNMKISSGGLRIVAGSTGFLSATDGTIYLDSEL